MASYTPVYHCKLVREGSVKTESRLDSSTRARLACNAYLAEEPAEMVITVMLDSKKGVIGVSPSTRGTLDASLVHPREVFRAAIIANASSVIVAHNHPSGDLTPSREDIEVYRRLRRAGDIVGIDLVDFIVVDGCGKTCSFKEEGIA